MLNLSNFRPGTFSTLAVLIARFENAKIQLLHQLKTQVYTENCLTFPKLFYVSVLQTNSSECR